MDLVQPSMVQEENISRTSATQSGPEWNPKRDLMRDIIPQTAIKTPFSMIESQSLNLIVWIGFIIPPFGASSPRKSQSP